MEKRREEIHAIRRRQRRNDGESWQWRLSFLGQRMGHNYYQYYLIDQVFAHHPDLKGVVEIGTGHGAMTIVLGLWGVKLDIPVVSIDHNGKLHDEGLFKRLDIAFFEYDEEADIVEQAICGVCSNGPVFMICDGGDKPAEFRKWAPEIPAGSVIAAHDWGMEIGPEDVAGPVEECGLVPFLPKRWDRLNVQFAMWGKV